MLTVLKGNASGHDVNAVPPLVIILTGRLKFPPHPLPTRKRACLGDTLYTSFPIEHHCLCSSSIIRVDSLEMRVAISNSILNAQAWRRKSGISCARSAPFPRSCSFACNALAEQEASDIVRQRPYSRRLILHAHLSEWQECLVRRIPGCANHRLDKHSMKADRDTRRREDFSVSSFHLFFIQISEIFRNTLIYIKRPFCKLCNNCPKQQ